MALESDFNSRTSCEVRREIVIPYDVNKIQFQLTHLLRGATGRAGASRFARAISTHAPLARCDWGNRRPQRGKGNFNSRTSCEVRRQGIETPGEINVISTHAPLARCDGNIVVGIIGGESFQLTHLLRGATKKSYVGLACCSRFQLTHLLRGATIALRTVDNWLNFNSRTSCEVRLGHVVHWAWV